MAFEKTVPEWNATGTEPPSSLKTSGFSAGYKPPAAYFNWFWHGVSECLKELQETVGGLGGDSPYLCNATSSDGTTYTATVDGITSLYTGLTIVFIPSRNSASTSATLNVNGLGAKGMRQVSSYSDSAILTPISSTWLASGKPVLMIYDGTYFVSLNTRANASDLYGTVAVTKGGTGATSAATARANLGAAPAYTYGTTDLTAGTSTLETGKLYFVYEE